MVICGVIGVFDVVCSASTVSQRVDDGLYIGEFAGLSITAGGLHRKR